MPYLVFKREIFILLIIIIIVIIIIIIIILIIIIKASVSGPSGQNKTVYKFLQQPNKHLRKGKVKRHNSMKQPTVNCSLKPLQRTARCQTQCIRTTNLQTHTNLIVPAGKPFCKLGRSPPCYSELHLMSCGRSSGISNSGRNRWKLTKQTMILVRNDLEQHTQSSNMTSKANDKKL